MTDQNISGILEEWKHSDIPLLVDGSTPAYEKFYFADGNNVCLVVKFNHKAIISNPTLPNALFEHCPCDKKSIELLKLQVSRHIAQIQESLESK